MAFKSYEELIQMSSKDPKMAMMYVNKANRSGKPVVSENNSGYKSQQKSSGNHMMDAVKRRIKKSSTSSGRSSMPGKVQSGNDDEHDYR